MTLADIGRGGSSFDWNADDTIVYGEAGKGIMQVSADGGTPELIVKATENGTYLYHPQILPGGKSILFMRIWPSPEKIIVQSLKSGERKELFEGNAARYLPTGHIVYAVGSNLFAVRFDISALKVIGGPVPVVEGVLRSGTIPQYAVSESGTLAYVPGTETAASPAQRTLVWVDRNGKEEPLAAPLSGYSDLRISPDGTKVALKNVTSLGRGDIWIWDLAHKTLTRLTFEGTFNAAPLWTPDGKRVAFALLGEKFGIHWKAADGTGNDELLRRTSWLMFPACWSGDGKMLIDYELSAETVDTGNFEIGALSMEGDRKWRTLLKGKYNEAQPRVSPNGKWMAYTSNESGQNQIYVRPFPDVDKGRWQISTAGGDGPLWSPDGRELFYRNGDAIMAVAVKADPTFSLETPRILFRGTYVSSGIDTRGPEEVNPWDISPDGKRFLMMKESSAVGGPRKINIVLNWFEELRQRVPVK